MNDAEIRLEEIKERVLAFARERDWEQFHSPKNLSMVEALQGFKEQAAEPTCLRFNPS